MGWDDAKTLPYATSTATIDGATHLIRVYRAVMDCEQEELPDGVTAHLKPVRATAEKDGTQTTPPSWRLRTTVDSVVLPALLQRGDAAPPITEVEIVAWVSRSTEGARAGLSDDKDDHMADWRIAAFEIVSGIKKKRRVKRFDPEYAQKQSLWRGRSSSDPTMEEPAPAKQITTLMEVAGFECRIAWIDMARQEEPNRGALGKYLQNGYFPRPFQEQRDEALRIIKGRQARAGVGEVSDLPDAVRADILAMAAGGMSAERIGMLLDLKRDAVIRVVTAAVAVPELSGKTGELKVRRNTLDAAVDGGMEKKTRKPRAKKEPVVAPEV